MPVPEAVQTADSNRAFEPQRSFVIVSGEERLAASGVVCVAPSVDGSWAAQAAALFAEVGREADLTATVVGALPFDHGRPAHLYQPRQLTRERCPRTAQPAPTHSRPRQTWRASSVPPVRDYERHVASVLPHLESGALHKIVLARSLCLETSDPIDLDALFARLLLDPSITAFQVPLPSATDVPRVLIGATPELLVEKAGTRVTSLPLAGSAPRQAEAGADRTAADALRRSRKDAREHAMVVEWIADRLTPYCERLSVPAIPSLTSTHSMWHLASHIEGDLRDPEITSVELAEVLHPTPAVCGVPIAEALDEIGRLEGFDREFFAGAVGWTDQSGDGRWWMTLRCAEVSGHVATLYAGAGIVHGSNPAAEAAETSAKLVAMLDALGADEEGHSRLADL